MPTEPMFKEEIEIPDGQAVSETVREVTEWLQYFDHLEATEPFIRLFIAAGIIGISILLMLASRIVIGRRKKRLEALPASRLRPLRLQAQELISSEDMKNLWLELYTWLGRALSLVFGLTALTGVLMTSHWTMSVAVRLIVLFLSIMEYIWSGLVGYLPNLITIICIVLIARFVIRTIGLIFEGIQGRRIHLKNFYPEWADTSYGIIKMLIYAYNPCIYA